MNFISVQVNCHLLTSWFVFFGVQNQKLPHLPLSLLRPHDAHPHIPPLALNALLRTCPEPQSPHGCLAPPYLASVISLRSLGMTFSYLAPPTSLSEGLPVLRRDSALCPWLSAAPYVWHYLLPQSMQFHLSLLLQTHLFQDDDDFLAWPAQSGLQHR